MLAGGQPSRVALLTGLVDSHGTWHRDADLLPLTGRHEAQLADVRTPCAHDVTTLLASCIARLGGYQEVGPTQVAGLTRGDRQYLLLQTRAALFGRQIALVARCPNPSCAEPADIDLAIDDLIPPSATEPPTPIRVSTPDGQAWLREPTGADDMVVEASPGGRDERVALLFCNLLLRLGDRIEIDTAQFLSLAAPTRHALALALAGAVRAPELAFVAPCPSCNALLEMQLDPADLLIRQLRLGSDRLLAEVHMLAMHYHWSEAEILGLPRLRRHRYLQLLHRQLEGRPLLVHGRLL